MKLRSILISIFFSLCTTFLLGQSYDYEINVKLSNYSETELSLVYYYGKSKYILETVQINNKGFFTFSKKEPIKAGLYLVVMKPDNGYFHILITENERKFTVHANAQNPAVGIRFENAPDNSLFYEYMSHAENIEVKNAELEIDYILADSNKKNKIQTDIKRISEENKAYEKKTIQNFPDKFTSSIIKANWPLEIPNFEGTKEEIEFKQREYAKKHYFDGIALHDEKMLRTPFLFQRVDTYINEITEQQPDSIIKSIDLVLGEMKSSEEIFKYFLIHFQNEYAKTTMVGRDAIYVHLALNYYAKGLAPWTEEVQMEKIIQNARDLQPLLNGNKAPNIQLQTREGKPIELYKLENELTVLFFWGSDKNENKTIITYLKNLERKYKNKGLQIVAICTKQGNEVNECWKQDEFTEMSNWMHLIDPYHKSRYKKLFNLKKTPQLYVLDRNKTILSKKTADEKLDDVFEDILKKLNSGK